MTKQTEIPGVEDPARVPEIDDRLHAWLDAKDEQRRASETRKGKEHLLLVAMGERGLERYPYVDSVTGKRRFFVADKTPKPKTIAAAGQGKRPRRKKEKAEDVVETRRVPRKPEHDQLNDPFGGTRTSLIDEAEKRQKKSRPPTELNSDTPEAS